ncbi:Pkinase-domain-containing protein [Dendrothele bispora CBS 962.96]|uniref:mitogen-activated protein kinase kinase kinase n=1 Tax=Dendrothele bispora (strain CBS 962.96) TaxID=1314807 RepID=A0A4S8KY69_DENBC|nr:Pkinase-domain-containing protein [Dendrothele bispora CBS 962.96]
MAAVVLNGHNPDSSDSPPKPSSPASPSFHSPQPLPRSLINGIRGQTSPFPTTPTSSAMSSFFDPPPGISFLDFIRSWSDSHVARWLADIKCANHAASFRENDIRGDILLELDQLTLQEMGITSIGDRLRILNAVKTLRQRVASRPVEPIKPPRLNTADDYLPGIGAEELPEVSPATRRRNGRPAPLHLPPASTNIRAEQQPDSARVKPGSVTVRPLPPIATPSSNASDNAHTPGLRSNLPPLPPHPSYQPPQPPSGRQPVRSGRRTPTQNDNPPAYTAQALPPAPLRDLLTPSSAGWSGGYHLPADPRPGNLGGGKPPQPTSRSTSPLPPNPTRPKAITSNSTGNLHGRNGSNGSSPNKRSGSGHPYANALQPPTSQRSDLSPIQEQFAGQHSATSASGTPSPPSQYPVSTPRNQFTSNTPSHSNAPSLDDLRRKLVKFFLPDEGLSFTIDADTCGGGVEIIERVLKKVDKGGSRFTDVDGSMDHVRSEDGGLSVDGWGVYLNEGAEHPLSEAELLSVCHAPLEYSPRENPLILRKISRMRRDGSTSPLGPSKFPSASSRSMSNNTKRASSISVLSGLGVRDPERALDPPSPTSGSGRASPVVSGRLSPSSAQTSSKRPSKLRNFFGQRPPSELITNHLTEFFPNTEKKVLRTARHSMMSRNHPNKRDSAASWIPPLPSRFSSSTQGSATRTSNSPTRTSFSSLAPPPLPEKPDQMSSDTASIVSEEIPRMSLSTEDGRSVELDVDGDQQIDKRSISSRPELLPPIPFPTESLSETLESITGGEVGGAGGVGARVSRASSTASRISRRLSYMTELRSKRDRSDTASLMTVDEITKEVESRRESKRQSLAMYPANSLDAEEWTDVGQEDPESSTLQESSEGEDEDEEDVSGEDDTLNDEDELVEDYASNEEMDGGARKKSGNKWIKGALIGAGSFGKVYLGMDASTGTLMAVKQVELPTGSAPNLERKKSMLSALEREIEFLQNLQHENIVQYLYSSLEDDCLNIFLEYVPGGSVTALLRNYGAFEEVLVSNFVRQILQGLSYLHERGIIHRDIKGANILVDNKGGVKISDFGISKKVDVQALSGNRAHRPSLQGSVFWMAPEVVKQSGHTQKADIWSVGCLVVEMLTGEHPWAQLTQMQAIFKIGSSAKPTIPADVSAEAQDFLARTFETNHEARPSASELLEHPFISRRSE